MSQEFLGVGWKYPLQLTAKKDIALTQAEDDIQEAIWIILGTVPGERLMHPDFGCRIHELVFAPNNANTAGSGVVLCRRRTAALGATDRSG